MTNDHDGVTIEPTTAGFRLSGDIDAHSAERIVDLLDPLPDGDDDIVLSMNDVEFIDSSGLRVLIEAHQRAVAAGRKLILASPSRPVLRVIQISGLEGYLYLGSDASD
ncbi:MAG TPA: STAS domain-containing protein [Ilumatobacteraceae bacterium]|nr:STAS domain-containing protein [Ilumatobacteraceae bacterium]